MLVKRNNPTLGELKKENEYLKKLLRDKYEFNLDDYDFNLRQERINNLEKLPLLDSNETVIWKISQITGVKVADIMSKSKVAEISIARFACFYALRKINLLTLAQIGRVFNRHHSTIIYGINAFETQASFKHNIEYQLIKQIQSL